MNSKYNSKAKNNDILNKDKTKDLKESSSVKLEYNLNQNSNNNEINLKKNYDKINYHNYEKNHVKFKTPNMIIDPQTKLFDLTQNLSPVKFSQSKSTNDIKPKPQFLIKEIVELNTLNNPLSFILPSEKAKELKSLIQILKSN